ncbi:organic cation transporter protein [Parasteatoda tepidariorum]|nr:organic cation transporter protein [Parasteatoda tepidariorum]XP_042898836.1 organic cation transporter protein [Parasteatoda tepidariorum]
MTADVENSTLLENKTKLDILDLVGNNGPWQRLIFIVSLICAIPIASQNLVITFFAPNLDHWCARPTGVNISAEEWKLRALPAHDQKCSKFKYFNITDVYPVNINYTDSDIVPCDSWEYDNSIYVSTVLSKWDLVCEQEWLVSLSKSVFVAGYLFSATVIGHFADKYGRKPIIVSCNIIALFSSVICAFSTSFLMFSVLRFLIAVGVSGVFNAAFVLLMEVVSPAYRPIYGLSINFGWCLGFVSLPLIAWIIRDWFWIQLFITVPNVFLLSSYWLLPESPRWLMSQGNIEEVERILTRAAKMNNVDTSDLSKNVKEIMVAKKTEGEEREKPSGNFLDLLRTPGLWQKTLNLFYLWCIIAFMYYGLSYNTNEMAGDPFINFAASGAIEIPGYFISIFIIKYYGRRNPLSASLIIGALACFLMYPLPQDPWWLNVIVSMVGKFCITCAFGVLYIYTAEIFPTVVRNVGMGSASLCARIGSIVAPFVRELGHATHAVVPQIIYGVLAGIAGLLVLLLPETNNCRVPDTLEEAAKFTRKRSCVRETNHLPMQELVSEKT